MQVLCHSRSLQKLYLKLSLDCGGGFDYSIVEGTKRGASFAPENVVDSSANFKTSDGTNYYVPGDKSGNSRKGFTLALGCTRKVNGIRIKNSRSFDAKDRGTKEFELLGAMDSSGPWTNLLTHEMVDPRSNDNIQEEILSFPEKEVKFIKWDVKSKVWGTGAALSYLKVKTGNQNKTF